MTVTVKLITEQTTNQLVDSVNRAQADGWFPVCGVVCFNARYTQLMTMDTNATEVPACNYFIVDAADGVSFAERVNQLLSLNSGATCLSSVQYVQARYIQAYGDDSHGGGGGGGGDLLKWYTENAAKTHPIIDTDTNLPEIELGNEWAGYLRLIFRTGGNNAGYIHADDGELILRKIDGSELTIADNDLNMLIKGVSVFNSNGEYTNLIAQGAGVTLAPGFAGITSPAGSLELDETRGIKLYGNGGVNSVIDANPTQATFGDNAATTNVNGSSLVLDANGKGTLEMDANALRFKRGTNQLFSISDSSGAMTWNSYVRCVWNADGWNVSRDNGVAFTSRATLSAMIGPGDSRVEVNATGVSLTSNQYSASAGKLNLTNTAVTMISRNAEVFNSNGDNTSITTTAGLGVYVSDGTGILYDGGTETHQFVRDIVPNTTESLGTFAKPWTTAYLHNGPFYPETGTASAAYVSAATVALWSSVVPKEVTHADNTKDVRFVSAEVIAALTLPTALALGLVAPDGTGKYSVCQQGCLMMEALYIRSRLP